MITEVVRANTASSSAENRNAANTESSPEDGGEGTSAAVATAIPPRQLHYEIEREAAKKYIEENKFDT